MPDLVTGVGGTLGLINRGSSNRAADNAADAQVRSTEMQIEESRRQFDLVQELLEPFVSGGTDAFQQMMTLAGMDGGQAEREAVRDILESQQYKAAVQEGEEAILANASATGGLRGGNTAAALAQFRPQILSQLTDQRYQRLGGLAQMGQSSAAGVGSAAQATGAQVSSALGTQGQAVAGAALARGQNNVDFFSGLARGIGNAWDNGAFEGWGF